MTQLTVEINNLNFGLGQNNNASDKIEFEVYYNGNMNGEDQGFSGNIGIFETKSNSDTFQDFMPRIANFFMKDEDKIFLMDEQERILLKSFRIWETLTPFMNTRMKNTIPKLRLVMTGRWKESDNIRIDDRVSQ